MSLEYKQILIISKWTKKKYLQIYAYVFLYFIYSYCKNFRELARKKIFLVWNFKDCITHLQKEILRNTTKTDG